MGPFCYESDLTPFELCASSGGAYGDGYGFIADDLSSGRSDELLLDELFDELLLGELAELELLSELDSLSDSESVLELELELEDESEEPPAPFRARPFLDFLFLGFGLHRGRNSTFFLAFRSLDKDSRLARLANFGCLDTSEPRPADVRDDSLDSSSLGGSTRLDAFLLGGPCAGGQFTRGFVSISPPCVHDYDLAHNFGPSTPTALGTWT